MTPPPTPTPPDPDNLSTRYLLTVVGSAKLGIRYCVIKTINS